MPGNSRHSFGVDVFRSFEVRVVFQFYEIAYQHRIVVVSHLCTRDSILMIPGAYHLMFRLLVHCRLSSRYALSVCSRVRAFSYLSLPLFNPASELSEGATTVIAFYATSLSLVGPLYQAPSLAFLAQRWFDSSSESSQTQVSLANLSQQMNFDMLPGPCSMRQLCGCRTRKQTILSNAGNTIVSGLVFLTISALTSFVVPCLQPTADRESLSAALSLFICGYIGAEKYSLLSTRYGVTSSQLAFEYQILFVVL